MVRVKGYSEFEKLESTIAEISSKHKLKMYTTGWTRKTYDIFKEDKRQSKAEHMARIESLAMVNGEIRFFDDRAQDFVQELGEALESVFGLEEAVIIREKPPGY